MVGGKVTKRRLPPRTLPPIRSIDVGTEEIERTGGITIIGEKVGGRGTGRGGSGSGLSPSQIAELQRQTREAQAKQKEIQKEIAIEKQREVAQRVKERIAAEKAQEQKIRAMTAQKRKQFFRKQALISRAQSSFNIYLSCLCNRTTYNNSFILKKFSNNSLSYFSLFTCW